MFTFPHHIKTEFMNHPFHNEVTFGVSIHLSKPQQSSSIPNYPKARIFKPETCTQYNWKNSPQRRKGAKARRGQIGVFCFLE